MCNQIIFGSERFLKHRLTSKGAKARCTATLMLLAQHLKTLRHFIDTPQIAHRTSYIAFIIIEKMCTLLTEIMLLYISERGLG